MYSGAGVRSMLSVRFGWLVALVTLLISQSAAHAQTEARKREAAAQAYDQGTTAYVAQDYEKAAEWFETANRMSPAAPALIQGARAHQQAGHLARAATLALALVQTYPDDSSATQFGEGVLNDLSAKLVRVDVECDVECTLDVDGTLQENHSFFVDPGDEHTVTASFETGDQRAQVSGSAGESKTLSFEAPPEGTRPPDDEAITGGGTDDKSAAPLSPVFTYVGIGLTAALLVGSIASTLDVYSGADDYEEAADKWRKRCSGMDTPPNDCDSLHEDAEDKLDDGHGKETRTTVLWVATGAVAAITTVMAVAFTDWSGEEAQETASQRLRLAVGATGKSAALTLKGTF
jgi:hypothetical protein